MPGLNQTYGGPVSALVGYLAAGTLFGARSTVVGPRCTGVDAAWLSARVPPDTRLVLRGAEGSGPWTATPMLLSAIHELVASADLVHVHGLLNSTSTAAARIAIRAHRPVVIGPFGTMSRYTFSYRRSLAKRAYFKAFDLPNLRQAAGLHFTTPAERDDAAWHGLDVDGRTYIVPPPFDFADAGPRAVGRDASAPVVLFLGRLHPVKGIEVLLDAWPAVVASFPHAELRIAGTGPRRYVASLQARAQRLGAAGSAVRFLGFLRDADKARQLAEAAVLALPSRHENFGIVVLDAVASGAPVVVTPGVQLAPWVDTQRVGRVVDRAGAAVAQALVDVLGDGPLRARVATRGRQIVAAEFSPLCVAPALEAMYAGALHYHRRAA